MAKADRSQPVVASGGSDAANTPTADDRYLALLERLSDRLGDEGPELVLELDRCVSDRLTAAQDGALDLLVIGLRTECSPGVARWVTTGDKGYDPIRQHEAEEAFLGRLRDELDANRTECSCFWASCEGHDELLRIEDRGFDGIFDLLYSWAVAPDTALENRRHPPAVDFEEFVACHNWRDPQRMCELAQYFRDVFGWFKRAGERNPGRTAKQVDDDQQVLDDLDERLRRLEARLANAGA